MKSKILTAAACAALWTATANATPIIYATDLSGPAENPANGSTATGHAVVTIDVIAHTLRVEVVFAGLSSGNTAAHIHCCIAPPGNARSGGRHAARAESKPGAEPEPRKDPVR